jgi:very-short-patch-repair endonuclease
MNQNPPLPTRTRSNARSLRSTQTEAQSALWFHLHGGRLSGLKFRRQHSIPPYIVDFYGKTARLVIELDESHHNDGFDAAGTAALEQQGLRVVRFWDNDVLQRKDSVLAANLCTAQDPTLTPTPLPAGEGL